MGGLNNMNLAIAVAGLSICALGLVQAIISRPMEKRTRRYFIAFFSLLVAYVGANLIGQLTSDVIPQMITLFLESALSSVLTLLLMSFLLERSGERNWRRSAAFRIASWLWLVYIALLVYTQFSATIYYFDAEGVYHRGPYYPVLLVPPVLIMLMDLLLLWSRRDKLSQRERRAFAAYILVPLACMLFQMLFFGIYVIVLGSSVSAMVMFLYTQNEQSEQFYRQQEENAKLRTDIMLSQIQPHFLYNTLGAIQSLCGSAPEAAERATAKFTRYLQGNMSALKESGAMPFDVELKHTKAYLELEQIRFEDMLIVRYDITCTDFLLPTLTLQPIVENAVRHGARGREEGAGTVDVATREYPDRYEITVTDDGPGFDPAAPVPTDDGRPHIGIPNVRDRLRRVCGGELRIESEIGKGTTATIILPKKKEEK